LKHVFGNLVNARTDNYETFNVSEFTKQSIEWHKTDNADFCRYGLLPTHVLFCTSISQPHYH